MGPNIPHWACRHWGDYEHDWMDCPECLEGYEKYLEDSADPPTTKLTNERDLEIRFVQDGQAYEVIRITKGFRGHNLEEAVKFCAKVCKALKRKIEDADANVPSNQELPGSPESTN